MDDLNKDLETQRSLGQEIDRRCKNYGKDGQSRKTQEYFLDRYTALSALWAEFQLTDKTIRTYGDIYKGTAYYQKEYFQQVEKIATACLLRMASDANSEYRMKLGRNQTAEREWIINWMGRTRDTERVNTESNVPETGATSSDGYVAPTPPTHTSNTVPTTAPPPPPTFGTLNTSSVDQLIQSSEHPRHARSTVEQGSHTHNSGGHNSRTETHTYEQVYEPTEAARNLEKTRTIHTHRRERVAAAIRQLDDMLRNGSNSVALKQRSALLESQWTGYETIFMELLCIAKNTGQLNAEFTNYEADFHRVITEVAVRTVPQTERVQEHRQSTSPNIMKLKPIEIPKFTGNIEGWMSFKDLFTTLYHQNGSISSVEKLHYLRSCLDGEAAKLISHLEITSGNYENAWSLVQNRYENKRALVNRHLEVLFNIQPVITESPYHLRKVHDTVRESLYALQNLQIQTDTWDPILLHVIIKKVDKGTHRLYEDSLKNPRELQPLKEFLAFVEHRCQTLEAIKTDKVSKPPTPYSQTRGTPQTKAFANHSQAGSTCAICDKTHGKFTCPTLDGMNVFKRNEVVREKQLCIRCFMNRHPGPCEEKISCKVCKRQHNSQLHLSDAQRKPKAQVNVCGANEAAEQESTPAVQANICENFGNVLLATAQVSVQGKSGQRVVVRALIDPGSQASFITKQLVDSLGIPVQRTNTQIVGIGDTCAGAVQAGVTLTIKPAHESKFELTLDALIMKKLTALLTGIQPNNEWRHTDNLQLADPDHKKGGHIDLIIGADYYSEILLPGIIKGEKGTPVAQQTNLGWILSGRIDVQKKGQRPPVCLISTTSLDEQLQRFWELEEIPELTKPLTVEESQCEKLFATTHTREQSGKYVVALPFKMPRTILGDSRRQALVQLYSLEKRFERVPKLKEKYQAFMAEYLEMGHMKLAERSFTEEYFFPHHAVFKEDSTTTKLRVVFNGSQKSSNGVSLNDQMLVGPRLQDELVNIVLRGRKHRVALSADIEKMYRQILVAPADRHYQKILWRHNPNEPIREYELNTVTYGTASAPYLAVKVLQQHAINNMDVAPQACKVIQEDFYVDDLFSGCHSVEEAIKLRQEITDTLMTGGLPIRKWSSNSMEVLETIPTQHRELGPQEFGNDQAIKTLGIFWHPQTDQYGIKVNIPPTKGALTKRKLLAEISSLFDPLGIVAPVVISAKILMQRLWLDQLDWDDNVSEEISQQWVTIKNELPIIGELKFDRWINYMPTDKIELHGFADASERAYAAVVFSRITKPEGTVIISVLASKTRVAPLNQVSLPRLELCAAKLLVDLLVAIRGALRIDPIEVYGWTDSKIVLAWLNGESTKWKTFVANRVADIQRVIPYSNWSHIAGEENPADCASRGILATQLEQHHLWWAGPQWLKNPRSNWPTNLEPQSTNEEARADKGIVCTTKTESFSELHELAHKYSSWFTIRKVTAYVKRFIHNTREPAAKRTGNITTQELNEATHALLATAQQNFKEVTHKLRNNVPLNKHDKLMPLNPFIDKAGLLRVGGRLQNASVSYDAKHQVLLPGNNRITQLILTDLHHQLMHGGCQLMLTTLRKKFWIIRPKHHLRSIIHEVQKVSNNQIRSTNGKPPCQSSHLSETFQ